MLSSRFFGRLFEFALSMVVSCNWLSPALASEVDAAAAKPLLVDRVWAGTRVGFDAVIAGTKAYVGYYDSERYLTVAEVDLQSGTISKKRIDNRYGGWDSHNYVTLFYDAHGILHVTGNEHATKLVYARTQVPGDFSSLERQTGIVGNAEEKVTYPIFLETKNGSLAFIYRDGGSGDGNYIIDGFDGKKWNRLLSTPLFSNKDGADTVSAYPTYFVRDKDGDFHVAWVWRASPDARTNFDVSYASSPDLVSWFNAKGDRLELPITPTSDVKVESIPQGAGLFNNLRLAFDLKNRPVISYQKYDQHGYSQVYHAALRGRVWTIAPFTNWNYRWNFGGSHSIASEISFSGVLRNGQVLTESVHSSRYGNQVYKFDPETLGVIQVGAPVTTGRSVKLPSFAPYYGSYQLQILASPSGSSTKYKLVWGAMPPGNHDEPRSCNTPGVLPGCEFISELYLVSDPEGH